MNKRKTMIGYVTYQVGRRVVRRQVRRRVTSLLSTPERSSLRRRLPRRGHAAAILAELIAPPGRAVLRDPAPSPLTVTLRRP
jgi:hypothetical protein